MMRTKTKKPQKQRSMTVGDCPGWLMVHEDDDVAAVSGHLDSPKLPMTGMLLATTMGGVTMMAESEAVATASLVEGDLHLTLEGKLQARRAPTREPCPGSSLETAEEPLFSVIMVSCLSECSTILSFSTKLYSIL